MSSKWETTYTVRIYMAGDIAVAKQFLRHCCWNRGLCVTVEPTLFIYTGGEEQGFVVGLVNYPRFPSTPREIFTTAQEIAEGLIYECLQRSALVVGSDQTLWLTRERPSHD